MTTPKAIVGFYESSATVGPNEMPLTPIAGSTSLSETFIVRQAGPIDVGAGDCLDVSAREQFSNRNDANGWWTVNGVKSEHWWLWVGGYASVRYSVGPPANAMAGSQLVTETGQNWDWGIHRWHWDVSEVHCFDSAIANLYVFTTVRFSSSPSYRQSDDQFIINDQRGRVEALHLGGS